MEEWAKWLAEFEEALQSEYENEVINEDMVKLLKREIEECKENLND